MSPKLIVKLSLAAIGLVALGILLPASASIASAPYRMSYEAGIILHRWERIWTYGMAIGALCAFAWINLASSQVERLASKLALACIAAAFILGVGGSGPHSIVSAKNVCINNLRQIDGAKEQWAIEYGKA